MNIKDYTAMCWNMAQAMGRKGASVTNSTVDRYIMVVVFILIVVALLPTLFGSDGLGNLSGITGLPTWVATILPVIVGVVIVLMVWKTKD